MFHTLVTFYYNHSIIFIRKIYVKKTEDFSEEMQCVCCDQLPCCKKVRLTSKWITNYNAKLILKFQTDVLI